MMPQSIVDYQGAKSAGGCGQYESRCRAQNSVSLGHRVPLVYPVRAEIVGDVEHLHVGESHGVQSVVGGFHVGTMAPGAAAAIQNDELGSRQRFHALAELLQSGLTPCGTDIFRSRDVRLREQDVGSDLDHEWLFFVRSLNQLDRKSV